MKPVPARRPDGRATRRLARLAETGRPRRQANRILTLVPPTSTGVRSISGLGGGLPPSGRHGPTPGSRRIFLGSTPTSDGSVGTDSRSRDPQHRALIIEVLDLKKLVCPLMHSTSAADFASPASCLNRSRLRCTCTFGWQFDLEPDLGVLVPGLDRHQVTRHLVGLTRKPGQPIRSRIPEAPGGPDRAPRLPARPGRVRRDLRRGARRSAPAGTGRCAAGTGRDAIA